MYPSKSWSSYEEALRAVGERRFGGDEDDAAMLRELGLVVPDGTALTVRGQAYFDATYIRGDPDTALGVLRDAVSNLPPASVILQFLYGVAGADKPRAGSVLRSRGFDDGLTDRKLSTLLVLMARADLIEFEPRGGRIHVLRSPTDRPPRNNVFISSETPFGNRIWLRRALESCDGFIYWLDKHFMPAAFESIWEAADGDRASDIRILSLRLPEHEGRNPRREYSNLKRDLSARGITFEWRWVDSQVIRGTHDRMLIGRSQGWNLPNVNAILSGQNSEMLRTPDYSTWKGIFDGLWANGAEAYSDSATT
jgi:hypothetical protein